MFCNHPPFCCSQGPNLVKSRVHFNAKEPRNMQTERGRKKKLQRGNLDGCCRGTCGSRGSGATQIRTTRCVILIPRFHFHLRSAGEKKRRRPPLEPVGITDGVLCVRVCFNNNAIARTRPHCKLALTCLWLQHACYSKVISYNQKKKNDVVLCTGGTMKTFFFILLIKSKQAKTGTGDRLTFSSSRCYF